MSEVEIDAIVNSGCQDGSQDTQWHEDHQTLSLTHRHGLAHMVGPT